MSVAREERGVESGEFERQLAELSVHDTIDDLPPRGSRFNKRAGLQLEPHLFLLLQCDNLRVPSARYRLNGLSRVHIGRGRYVERGDETNGRHLHLRLRDNYVSSAHAELSFDGTRWTIHDTGSRNGILINGRRVERAEVTDGDLIEVGRTFLLFGQDLASSCSVRAMLDTEQSRPVRGLETMLHGLEREFQRLTQVARSSTPIQILGDTGTGKEVIAQAVHQLSGRAGPFVAVNCGALPSSLVESELFGHRKGAFSGANENRLGWVRSADGGTLLLDEIGDLPLPAQASLLRVLQEREVVPVGDHKPSPVDLSVCSATHRDLDALVEAGQFRRDLLTRLQGHQLRLPSLAQRRADLGLLTRLLIRRLAGSGAERVTIQARAFRALCRYDWPGNIRELEKSLSVALALSLGESIDVEHLPGRVTAEDATPRPVASPPPVEEPPGPAIDAAPDAGPALDDADTVSQLIHFLQLHRGNVAAVARAMGKHPFQIHRWVKRWDLDLKRFRTLSPD
jgi:DNA-binding NtrC family response regulator